jgi:hypothetical protein
MEDTAIATDGWEGLISNVHGGVRDGKLPTDYVKEFVRCYKEATEIPTSATVGGVTCSAPDANGQVTLSSPVLSNPLLARAIWAVFSALDSGNVNNVLLFAMNNGWPGVVEVRPSTLPSQPYAPSVPSAPGAASAPNTGSRMTEAERRNYQKQLADLEYAEHANDRQRQGGASRGASTFPGRPNITIWG